MYKDISKYMYKDISKYMCPAPLPGTVNYQLAGGWKTRSSDPGFRYARA